MKLYERDVLNQWEFGFYESIKHASYGDLSSKQRAIMDTIKIKMSIATLNHKVERLLEMVENPRDFGRDFPLLKRIKKAIDREFERIDT